MGTRLDIEDTEVTWSESRRVVIGYLECFVCKAETPRPSAETLTTICQHQRCRFVWPFEYWQPEGWTVIDTHHAHPDTGSTGGHICPACTKKVADVLGVEL